MDTLITRIPNASALDSDDSNRLDLTLKMDMQRPKGYRIFRILTPMMTPTKLLLFLLPVTLRTSQLPAKTRNRTQVCFQWLRRDSWLMRLDWLGLGLLGLFRVIGLKPKLSLFNDLKNNNKIKLISNI
ncbi:uncharacterized protein LOC120158501 isoform X1 [Hibiscus syriacus]|uniref:uncharacterized protein LOC120158501 isoform X1 n=1 Tax=Hibiscus syriacus TaxID=106335 RepID=UPI0019242B44|nr:uncharacterized protein LOC120158501 isoform X1 [Hibiscus syriacus]